MNFAIPIMLSLIALSATATEPSALEDKLSYIELRSAKFISGKEKMTSGYAELAPNIRQIVCGAYPIATDKATIKDLKKEIAYMEEKENFTQLSAEQIARLATQKDVVAKFSPGIDCTAFK